MGLMIKTKTFYLPNCCPDGASEFQKNIDERKVST